MSKALIAGINQVAADKGLDHEIIFDAIEAALISAYKRNYGSVANVTAEIDRATGEMKVFAEREVVEDVMNPNTEIELEKAREVDTEAELGDVVRVQSAPKNFGRIAAQTAKQVILQRIREAERDTVYENFIHQVGDIINAQVRSVDTTSGTVTVLLGDKHESLLPREEQIPTESLRRGDYIRLYVVDVHKSNRGPVIKLSRTHRNLLRRLMEQEIPEVREGTVELKAIAREPGARSKVAVAATMPGVDPVGSCVGMRGIRIQNIVNELAGEKIDVVEWNMDLRTYIANALSPAKVQNVVLDEENSIKTAIVIVPDRQLSLAIGKEGQNARLAAKLTGWRIDIKSETEAHEEGLDVLAAEQAQLATSSSGKDLLAMAERILRSDGSGESDERLRQAAEAVQKADEQESKAEEEKAKDIPDWPELPEEEEEIPSDLALPDTSELDLERSEEESQAALDAFNRAIESVSEEESQIPNFDRLEDEEKEEAADESDAGQAELEAVEPEGLEPEELEAEEPSESDVMEAEELPEVITADMLRQRMAKRQTQKASLGDLDDIEVPAELLAGLDEEEDEEWDDKGRNRKGKGSKAAKGGKKSKKRRPKRRYYEDEEDEEDYEEYL